MEKKINYLARDFQSIKSELIKFSNQYYPELADDYNDSSVGSWFIDLMSAVGDDLSYHTDRMYQETNINSANMRNTVFNIARTNGLKVPGPKASMAEVRISCVLPVDSTNISLPDWRYAPIVARGGVVSAGNYNFEIQEDVDFGEQFNKDGFSNRTIVPSRNSNGNITGYTVSKTAIVMNGSSKVYKKVLGEADIQPFMEVVLPEQNVMNIESIIFKETSNYSNTPSVYEYYIDEEQYRISEESVKTYRFFECDSLADQWRFGTETNIDNGVVKDIYNPEAYEDYSDLSGETNNSTTIFRYYRGKWKPLTQKFITEYTDNGYMKIIFGSGVAYDEVPVGQTKYADYIASKIINNDMLGVLPKAGWTMYVLYRVGGGISTNLGPGSINTLGMSSISFRSSSGMTASQKGSVVTSMQVSNISTAVAGKDAPSTEEIKYLVKYNTGAQNRCVTVKDYKVRLMEMPPKYGAPFRNTVIESNNKIEMSLLGLDSLGKLDLALPQTLVENILEYMTHYKSINDYLEIKSGKIYNIGISADIFVDKNYTTSDVISNVITKVKEYFDVENHDMGDDIFIGDLQKEISLIDGVISVIEIRVYNIYYGSYSPDISPLPTYVEGSSCNSSDRPTFQLDGNGAQFKEIDLNAIDYVLYGDYNSMFEILNSNTDIQIRAKLR